jgi:two-component system, OmpR family, sensor histidine kinase MtrB
MRRRTVRALQRGQLRRIGLRWRITIAFLGGALAVSALVAGTTYVLVERYLLEQRVEESLQQAYGSVGFAQRYLSRPEGEVSIAELASLAGARGGNAVVMQGTLSFPSSLGVSDEFIPDGLRDAVNEGRVGYAFTESPSPQLVFGSPVPQHGELDVYFFYRLSDLEATLRILRNVLIGVSLGAVIIAALAGTRVSRRVVDPVRRASHAARRVAEGLLETRMPVSGRDELAALASSFNEMAAALEERIGREKRFVSDVSHELRTPLTTLRTSTEYLLEHADSLTPAVRRAVELLAADLD